MESAAKHVESPSGLIDARIEELDDWRGDTLSGLRTLIKQAAPDVIEIRRAIDVHEDEENDEQAFTALIRAAVSPNESAAR